MAPKHLLVVADDKRPGQQPPFTYDRKLVYVVSLAKRKPQIKTVMRNRWISKTAVSPDGKHFITTTRDGTSCWKLGETKPIWTKSANYLASFGAGDWILLHRGTRALICSLEDGRELWQKDKVLASRLEGSRVWLFSEQGVEVMQAGDGFP